MEAALADGKKCRSVGCRSASKFAAPHLCRHDLQQSPVQTSGLNSGKGAFATIIKGPPHQCANHGPGGISKHELNAPFHSQSLIMSVDNPGSGTGIFAGDLAGDLPANIRHCYRGIMSGEKASRYKFGF